MKIRLAKPAAAFALSMLAILATPEAYAFGFPYYGPGSGYGDFTRYEGAPPAAVVTQTSAYSGRYRNPYLNRNPALRGFPTGGTAPVAGAPAAPVLNGAAAMGGAPVSAYGVPAVPAFAYGAAPSPTPPVNFAYPSGYPQPGCSPCVTQGYAPSFGAAPVPFAPPPATGVAPAAAPGVVSWAPPSAPESRRRPTENPSAVASDGEALIDPAGFGQGTLPYPGGALPGEMSVNYAPGSSSWGFGSPGY